MKNPTYRPFIASAVILTSSERADAPVILGTISFEELCARAHVKLRVSQVRREITCVRGAQSFQTSDRQLVGGAARWPLKRTDALRVLETLAHGFHDYAARECICGRKLFVPPRRHGRPSEGVRAKTARERMAAMRKRQRESRPDPGA